MSTEAYHGQARLLGLPPIEDAHARALRSGHPTASAWRADGWQV